MKLLEFFSRNLDINYSKDKKDKNIDQDDLFFFMLDDDDLHKQFVIPNGLKLKKLNECGMTTIRECWMPMVKEGCKKYFEKMKMQGNVGKIFDQDLREAMCQRLHDHYFEDFKQGHYNLGEW